MSKNCNAGFANGTNTPVSAQDNTPSEAELLKIMQAQAQGVEADLGGNSVKKDSSQLPTTCRDK